MDAEAWKRARLLLVELPEMAERLGRGATAVTVEELPAELVSARYDLLLIASHATERCIALARLKATHPLMPIVVVGSDDETVARAIAVGASEFLPIEASEAQRTVRLNALLAWRRLALEARSNARRRAGRGPWFGHSERAQSFLEKVDALALCDAALWLHGPAGCRPERIARVLHRAGPRTSAPFRTELDLNARDGGTLFIGNYDELPACAREALATAARRGADVRFRLIAFSASPTPDPSWLGEVRLQIPALADRPEDLPETVEEALDRATLDDGRTIWIDDDAMVRLRQHRWPGDVEELESRLAAARQRTRGATIGLADLDLPPVTQIEADPFSTTLERAELYTDEADRAVDAAQQQALDRTIERIEEALPPKRKKYRIR